MAQTVDLEGFEVETFVRGLREPVAFDFLAAGEFFVLERRTGNVRWVRDGKILRTIYRAKVSREGDHGGLGLVLDPDFASNGYVYLFYSAASPSGGQWLENRLERLEFDGANLINGTTLLRVPKASDQDGPDQNGGVLRFGPDGKLYGLVGSLGRGVSTPPAVEQNTGPGTSSGAGGVFRVETDGTDAAGNPFIASADAGLRKWFVYGVRDGSGLTFDPISKSLWFTERGPDIYDEINRARAGMNSGWLKIAGPDRRDATYAANGNTPANKGDLVKIPRSKYVDPAYSFAESTGVGPLTFVETATYGRSLRNQLLLGDANGDLHLFQLKKKAKQRKKLLLKGPLRDRVADGPTESASSVFGTGFGDVRDLRVGPDGLLYVVDRKGGRVLRLVPASGGDQTAMYRVTFDAAWSSTTHPDPDFPGNPHFSGLIGATHNSSVTFWERGEKASDGIKAMAELGSKSPLDAEVRTAIAASTAEQVLSGGGVGRSPGSVSLTFEISADYPLVTLVAMLAPSPDWFVGVHDLSLFQDGAWADHLTVNLFPYDAGTDSGENYGSPNSPTVPPAAIARINGSPFAVAGKVPRLGQFVFERLQ